MIKQTTKIGIVILSACTIVAAVLGIWWKYTFLRPELPSRHVNIPAGISQILLVNRNETLLVQGINKGYSLWDTDAQSHLRLQAPAGLTATNKDRTQLLIYPSRGSKNQRVTTIQFLSSHTQIGGWEAPVGECITSRDLTYFLVVTPKNELLLLEPFTGKVLLRRVFAERIRTPNYDAMPEGATIPSGVHFSSHGNYLFVPTTKHSYILNTADLQTVFETLPQQFLTLSSDEKFVAAKTYPAQRAIPIWNLQTKERVGKALFPTRAYTIFPQNARTGNFIIDGIKKRNNTDSVQQIHYLYAPTGKMLDANYTPQRGEVPFAPNANWQVEIQKDYSDNQWPPKVLYADVIDTKIQKIAHRLDLASNHSDKMPSNGFIAGYEISDNGRFVAIAWTNGDLLFYDLGL